MYICKIIIRNVSGNITCSCHAKVIQVLEDDDDACEDDDVDKNEE